MSLTLLSAALLLSSVSADFNADASVVSSAASVLSNSVTAWNSNSGLIAALGIQGYFPTLTSAVSQLASDAASLTDSGVDVSVINAFGNQISGLLAALTAKASDFSNVGAGTIVKNDLSSIGSPAQTIVNDIVGALSGDCAKGTQLTSALNAVSASFAAANSAYGASQLTFSKLNC